MEGENPITLVDKLTGQVSTRKKNYNEDCVLDTTRANKYRILIQVGSFSCQHDAPLCPSEEEGRGSAREKQIR